MKNTIKQFIYIITTTFLMFIPVMAGQVELQTEVPFYTVREGVELTEEEQLVIDATLGYFLENPDSESIQIDSDEFPILNGMSNDEISKWFSELINSKIITINKCFTFSAAQIYGKDNIGYIYSESMLYVSAVSRKSSTVVTIKNEYIKQALQIREWVAYTYALVPSLGIENGMDEIEAVGIINDFVCNYLSYSFENCSDYLNIHHTQKGTCGDYAYLFKALAKGAGIETKSIVNELHAWNEIVIDDFSYGIDPSWNDINGFNNIRRYFMLPTDEIRALQYHNTILFVEY